MSVCYFLGAKSGVAKKTGKWFGMAIVLGHDQYGGPAINKYWFDSADSFKSACESVLPGYPVYLAINPDDGKITTFSLDDRFEPLEIAPEFFGGGD